jgi:hypothetical protein
MIQDVRAGGALADSLEVARGFVQRGLDWLHRLPDGPEQSALAELAGNLIARDQ